MEFRENFFNFRDPPDFTARRFYGPQYFVPCEAHRQILRPAVFTARSILVACEVYRQILRPADFTARSIW